MKLSDYDKSLLAGQMGEARRIAMEKTIEYAGILGADELCTVTKAHMTCGALGDDYTKSCSDFDKVFSRLFLEKELELPRVADFCQCQDDISSCDAYQWKIANQTKEFFEHIKKLLDRASELGINRASTCTPYLTGWIPLMGEYFVSTESSNILFCNCIWGARGNGGGLGTTFLAMLTGRTPKWGLHFPENRKGTHVFQVECASETRKDWDLIGYEIGKHLTPGAVPVVAGNFSRPDIVKVKAFFSTLATTSGAEMCHIVGLSPEARSLDDALGGNQPAAVADITQSMTDDDLTCLCCQTPGPLDFVQLGCPHCTLEELRNIADYLCGKKVNPNVRMYVYTNISTLKMAEESKIADTILKAGAHLMTSGCVNITYRLKEGAHAMAFSSAKLAHYQKAESALPIYYGSDRQCIDAAVNGYWR